MRPGKSITGPLLLIAVGVVLLINSVTPNFHLFEKVGSYWPFLLIVWGVIQLLEVVVRFAAGRTLPVNGISGAGWFTVFLIALVGSLAYEAHRLDPWWQHGAFMRGVEAFGSAHDFSIETIQKPSPKNPRLIIESFRGDAKISAGPEGQVTLAGRKVVRAFEEIQAKQADAASPVELVTEGDRVIVRCHQDKADSRTRVITNLELTVPAGTSLEGTGIYGDFDVTGLNGNVDISSDNAGVRLQDIAGNVKVGTRQSDLIRCSNVKGNVELTGHGNDVELERIGGQVRLSGNYTGSVSLRDIARPVHVENMRTEYELKEVRGEVRMQRGNIMFLNVAGPLRLNAHASDVKLQGFSDSIDLSVDRGDVELRPDHLPLARMVVRTHSGNIDFDVPQTAGFAINAITAHGEIENDFSGSLQETTHGRSSRLEGAIGAAGPRIQLQTERGRIVIRKATAPASPATDASLRTETLAKVE